MIKQATVSGANRIQKDIPAVVVSAGLRDKTIKVTVERKIPHKPYGKRISRDSPFHVHDENNQAREGDRVIIRRLSKRISKTKSHTLIKIVGRSKKTITKKRIKYSQNEMTHQINGVETTNGRSARKPLNLLSGVSIMGYERDEMVWFLGDSNRSKSSREIPISDGLNLADQHDIRLIVFGKIEGNQTELMYADTWRDTREADRWVAITLGVTPNKTHATKVWQKVSQLACLSIGAAGHSIDRSCHYTIYSGKKIIDRVAPLANSVNNPFVDTNTKSFDLFAHGFECCYDIGTVSHPKPCITVAWSVEQHANTFGLDNFKFLLSFMGYNEESGILTINHNNGDGRVKQNGGVMLRNLFNQLDAILLTR